jgi:hypothetical protein
MHQPRRGRSSSRNRVGQAEEDDSSGINPFYSEEASGGSGASSRPPQVASSSNISHVEAAPQSEHERNAISAIRNVMPAISVHEVQPGGASTTQTQPTQSNVTAAALTSQSSNIQGPSATSAGHRAGHPANVQLVPPDAQIRELLAGDGVYHFNSETFQRFLEFERLQKITQPSSETLNQPRNSEPQGASDNYDNAAPERRSQSPSQPRLAASPLTASRGEIVTISSSSSSSENRSQSQRGGIITLHDTPPASSGHRSQNGDSSDDVPLVQRGNRASRGGSSRNASDDSGTSGKGRSRVSWREIQMGYSGTRCPVCGVTYRDPDEHNPFTCRDRNDGFNRSEAERQWLADFSALTRAWRSSAPQHEQQPPLPNVTLIEPEGGAATLQPRPEMGATVQRARVSTHSHDVTSHVRRDEQRAREAGTIHLGSNAQDRRDAREDAALESAHSSDAHTSASTSSSSWVPTTLESSLSAYQNRELKSMQEAMAAQTAQFERQRQDFQMAMTRMQEQHMQAMQQLQSQQHVFAQPPPMFMPPYGFIPNGPPMQPFFPMQPSAFPSQFDQGLHTSDPPINRLPASHAVAESVPASVPFHAALPHPSYTGDHSRERLQFTPAANHVEHAGMAGAPELEPEQLGKVAEFQKHVKTYNAYAMKAVGKHETHLSLAQTMSKHAFSLATAFTSQLMKRYRLAPHTFTPGDTLEYTPRMVLAMSDELFTRLYMEMCSIAIEDPSQVYAILSRLDYVRQTPEESSPLPALMRAEAAFRAKLSLLPQHAASRCRPQELRDAFIRMIFTEAKFDTMKLDFQQCTTWEHVYQQLIYRAGTSSTWYTEAPNHKTTPEVSVSTNVSSSSPAKQDNGNPEESKQASAHYWRDLFHRLRRSMSFDPKILEGAETDKRKAKILQKLKFRQQVESEIRDQVSKSAREQQHQRFREARDQGPERGSRAYDRRNDSPHRDERSQEGAYRGDRHRDGGNHPENNHKPDGQAAQRYQNRQPNSYKDNGPPSDNSRQQDRRDHRNRTPPPNESRRPQSPAALPRSPSQSQQQSAHRLDSRPSRSPSSGRSEQ